MMRNRLMSAVVAFAAVVAASGAVEVRQIFRAERFQRGDTNVSRLQEIDDASWIWHPTAVERGEVGKYAFLRFRKEFTADAAPLRFDVSADERFELLLDGAPIAFGPHRGIVENWLYQSYEAKLAPQPGGLKWIDAATPHPKGMILTKLRFDGDAVEGEVTLPDGVSGVFEWKGKAIPLKPGRQAIAKISP